MTEKVKAPMSERKPGMAANFAAAEHALGEACRLGYTPGKQGSMPTPPTAWLSHQDVKAFEIAFHKLRREYDKAVKDAEAFKAETRQLRETAEARAKRLAVSQKMFDRLVEERRSLEQTCKSQKAYIQKLEFRLSSEPRGPSMAERSVELRAGLQDAKDKIAQLHNVVTSQSQDLERAAKEIKTLNRALDLKLKDEAPPGHKGQESSVAALVRELAEAKVECQSLASELAVREERLQRVQQEMRALYDELDEERAAREQAKENEAHLMATVLRGAEVATELQGQVNGVSEEKHSLAKALEDQSARNLTLENLVASLREDHLKAAQAHKARLEAFQHKEAELQVAMEVLKEKLSKRDAVQAMTEEKLTEERRRIKTITDCLLDKDAKLRDANFEKKTLCEEVESLTQRVAEGTQRATQAEEAASRLRTESEELRSAFRRQEATALRMREEMESLLQDLRRVTEERDRAQEGLVQLKSMSHRQDSEVEERERQRLAQQAELARLQETKELMQKALLEELQLTKQSLAEEAQRRTSLELQVDRLRSTTTSSSLSHQPQSMSAATSDVHAYSGNQVAWDMDEKRKKQQPPQATITINSAMGRTPNPMVTSRPQGSSVVVAASSTAFIDPQGPSTRPLPRPLVMEDEQSEATNMVQVLPPPPAPPLPLSAPAPSLPSGSSDRNAVLLRLQDLILLSGQESNVNPDHLLLSVALDGDSKDITLRRNGDGRYECSRDACVQFVGTLRVLRKPLAFRLPALGAELGTIAVQDAIVANRFQLQAGPWLLSGSTSLPPSENET